VLRARGEAGERRLPHIGAVASQLGHLPKYEAPLHGQRTVRGRHPESAMAGEAKALDRLNEVVATLNMRPQASHCQTYGRRPPAQLVPRRVCQQGSEVASARSANSGLIVCPERVGIETMPSE
jgi:hypothetical protein